MKDLTENKVTSNLVEQNEACITPEEFVELFKEYKVEISEAFVESAKEQGIELSSDQVQKSIEALTSEDISDEDLENVAGGLNVFNFISYATQLGANIIKNCVKEAVNDVKPIVEKALPVLQCILNALGYNKIQLTNK